MGDITPMVLKGAAKLGAVGSALGPIGTGAGAVVGAISGIFSGVSGNRRKKEQMELEAPLIKAQTEQIELDTKIKENQVKRQKKIRNLMMGYR